ncbi:MULTISPECIES: DMT family transporter [Arthrobacter]|uniref:DMT family transporter n=1 Tax=Arthrobacter terricola TaxID=2547396 RepID=A0A4R5L1N8_9MICC|nr:MULTISPECIES: DMT family transporter [Arthrobacter]MBT8158921.1 DMT family transporter [Arthrobacter sp. GN70]TDG01603.1 DMT family transporter [Arthrobacter terricola]
MTVHSSVIVKTPKVLSHRAGLWWGLLGVTAFSFTVPLTRVATGGFSPLFIGSARAVIAAVLAIIALALTRQRFPNKAQWGRLAIVAGGVVVGFPMLSTYALTTAPASHGAVVIGLLPAATGAAAVLRGKERVSGLFWLFAGLGAIAVVAFAALQNGGLGHLGWPDLLLFSAVVAAAVGYTEGGLLARELGPWQTVSWALVLALPVMAASTAAAIAGQAPTADPAEWAAFAYLAVVSMFLGFFAWYRGLAIGPMAQVSQVQLAQPVMSIAWAGLILHEQLTWSTLAGGAIVILCAGLAVRTRLDRKTP